MVTSACGGCGRRAIDDFFARCAPVRRVGTVGHDVRRHAVDALRATQAVFARTGGCHGAALVTFAGAHVATCEDVGRHDAVDNRIGSRLLAGELPLDHHVLTGSGRTRFEIVQKAAAAGIPVVAGIPLVGFARGGSGVIYTGAEAIAGG